jgi:hypothetical protein
VIPVRLKSFASHLQTAAVGGRMRGPNPWGCECA